MYLAIYSLYILVGGNYLRIVAMYPCIETNARVITKIMIFIY